MNNSILKLYPILKEKALQSNMYHQLAACVIIERKLMTEPCCNINRNYCRGNICGSIHAELNALLHYYGKNLQFDRNRKRWYLLFYQSKKIKKS